MLRRDEAASSGRQRGCARGRSQLPRKMILRRDEAAPQDDTEAALNARLDDWMKCGGYEIS